MTAFSADSLLAKFSMLAMFAFLCACSTGAPYLPVTDRSKAGPAGAELEPPVIAITTELVTKQKAQRDNQRGQDIRRLVSRPSPYLIGPGDRLSIVVWGHPELATAVMTLQAPALTGAGQGAAIAPAEGFGVDHDGMLQFPFAGALKVSGLTQDQARDLLAEKIAAYINKPRVTLRVHAFRSQRIYVDGEVKTPGVQVINDVPMTLVEALNRAGGATPDANQSQIFVTRKGATYHINMLQLVQAGIDPTSIMLQNGDLVRVVSRDESKVFVVGEVSVPKSLMMHNGRLSLNEALGESGGINPNSGDARQVYIVRRNEEGAIVFRLDAQSPGALALAESFELNPRDLVYVAPTGLAHWYRTISQLIPSALPDARQATRK